MLIESNLIDVGFKKSNSSKKEINNQKIAKFNDIQKKLECNVVKDCNVTIDDNCGYQINYTKELNSNQLIAVTTINGPLMIIAGAGSGKTRTLTYRMSYMLENGIPPEKILLLTFTRKAAEEMVSRAKQLLNNQFNANKVIGTTFHSYANLILRKYGKFLGINSSFTIMDATDSADAIDLCAKNLDLRVKGSKFPKKGFCQKVISHARNWDTTIGLALQHISLPMYEEYHYEFDLLNEEYESFKKSRSVYDFDDLLLMFRDALKNNAEFKEKVQGLSDYIMVDEFQDTNVVQKEIIDNLAEVHRNLMVVGDDSQSIYAFRGANVENVFNIIETYPDAKIVKIEQNYRSTDHILNFANNVTNNALIGFQKRLYTEHKGDSKPIVKKCKDIESEASLISHNIAKLVNDGIPGNKIAVLARSIFHTNLIQLSLTQNNIDYTVMGGIRFIERKHIKDLLAHLKIMENSFDEVAWHRALHLIPNIGKATSTKVVKLIHKNNGIADFSSYSGTRSYPWLKFLEDLLRKKDNLNVVELIQEAIEYYLYIYEETTKDADSDRMRKDLEFLVKIAKNKASLKSLLNDLTLDPPDSKNEHEASSRVVVSTVHSSKGLEFDYVFIPHLLNGLFPSAKSMGTLDGEEEERRVFYVACTRAKDKLIMTYPAFYKTHNEILKEPSLYLQESKKLVDELTSSHP